MTGRVEGRQREAEPGGRVRSCNTANACCLRTMAKPLRLELAGGLSHVASRGARREEIFCDEHTGDMGLAMTRALEKQKELLGN